MTKSATRVAADEVSAPIASPVFTGNVGIGVVPESDLNTGSYSNLRIGLSGLLQANISGHQTLLGSNYKVGNLGNEYIGTGTAARYMQAQGAHYFSVAPSGSADAAISFTNAMTIANSGNVEVYGASTPKLTVKSGNGTSASIKLQRINENDTSTDYEIKNDGGALKIISDSTSQNEFLIQQIDSGTQRFNTNNIERMRISSAGTLLVKGDGTHGYVDAGESLSVSTSRTGTHDYGIFVTGNNSGGGTHYQMRFYNNVHGVKGSITTTSGGTAFNTSSDYRLKTDIQDVSTPIDKVKLLKPCNFAWVAEPDVRIDGFIAHEVAEVVPEAVSGTKDEMVDQKYEVTPAVLDDEGNETTAAVMGTRSVPQMQGVDQSKLVPLLTATIQELISRIEALEGK